MRLPAPVAFSRARARTRKQAFNGHLELLKLLEAEGADLFARNLNGNSVLHAACFRGHRAIVNYLLDESGGRLGPARVAASQGRRMFDLESRNSSARGVGNRVGSRGDGPTHTSAFPGLVSLRWRAHGEPRLSVAQDARRRVCGPNLSPAPPTPRVRRNRVVLSLAVALSLPPFDGSRDGHVMGTRRPTRRSTRPASRTTREDIPGRLTPTSSCAHPLFPSPPDTNCAAPTLAHPSCPSLAHTLAHTHMHTRARARTHTRTLSRTYALAPSVGMSLSTC